MNNHKSKQQNSLPQHGNKLSFITLKKVYLRHSKQSYGYEGEVGRKG